LPWFRVDDGFHSHPKVLATSLAARGLWVSAGSWSSGHLTDGVVPDHVLAALGGTPELAAELVSAGLWKRRRNGWQFHQWDAKNPTKVDVEKERRKGARRQALFRNGELRQAIRERDRDCCRYCGRKVRWGAGQAAASGSFDHIDPDGPNVLENLVVCCVACNSRKRDRTLEEADMQLRPPPVEAPTEATSNSYSPSPPTRPEGTDRPNGLTVPSRRANGRASPPGSPAVAGERLWCGECDPRTRMLEDAEGRPYRCRICNPAALTS